MIAHCGICRVPVPDWAAHAASPEHRAAVRAFNVGLAYALRIRSRPSPHQENHHAVQGHTTAA